MVTFLGALAGLFTTACWIPQLARSWRTRSTSDLSWLYLFTLTAGIIFWILYGVLTQDLAVIAANTATAVAVCALIVFKIQHKNPKPGTTAGLSSPDGKPWR